MKPLLYALLLIFAFFFFSACEKQIMDNHQQAAPLLHHPNQWLLINYWAPWCHACQQEIPELNQFYKLYGSHVLVYGVNYDMPSISELNSIAERMGIDFPLLTEDPASLLRLPNIEGLPITFIFNPNGQLVKILKGPQNLSGLSDIVN